MRRPSGDQLGPESASGSLVSLRTSERPTFFT
jgi:hypothetical protein